MIDVNLYALNEEDESMREQYSASPSVIVFCHSEHEGDDHNVDVHDLCTNKTRQASLLVVFTPLSPNDEVDTRGNVYQVA